MANVGSATDAVTALRVQLAGASYQSNERKGRAVAAVDKFLAELAAVGVTLSSVGSVSAPSAATLDDALGAMQQQLAVQTFPSGYARQFALGRFGSLTSELAALGLIV